MDLNTVVPADPGFLLFMQNNCWECDLPVWCSATGSNPFRCEPCCDVPVISGPLSASGDEGSSIALSVTFSYTQVADTHSATVDWKDGTIEVVAAVQAAGSGSVSLAHTYADDGVYMVDILLENQNMVLSATAIATVTVNNVAPVIVGTLTPASVNEGDTVSFIDLSFTDPSTVDTHSATIDWGDGSMAEAVAVDQALHTLDVSSLSHVYADDGVYTVTVEVHEDGMVSAADSVTTTATVSNVAPVVMSPVSLAADSMSVLTLPLIFFTDAGPMDIHMAEVSWGDGSMNEALTVDQMLRTVGGGGESHLYSTSGVFTATITVTDNGGLSGIGSIIVSVNNEAPLFITALGDVMSDEGSLVTLPALSFIDPSVSDSHVATCAWGDGAVSVATVDTPLGLVDGLSHIYVNEGIFHGFVTLNDSAGLSDSALFQVTVRNVPPAILTALPPASLQEGGSVVVADVYFTDAGLLDTHTARIDWGDGASEVALVDAVSRVVHSAQHRYVQDNTYVVTVLVTDDVGATNSSSFNAVVTNAPPVLDVPEMIIGDEGRSIPLTFTVSDAGVKDLLTVSVDWGDSGDIFVASVSNIGTGPFTALEKTVSQSHIYRNDGIFTVTVMANDSDGGITTTTANARVENAAPVFIDPIVTAQPVQGLPLYLYNMRFRDAGELDTHTATVSWGDGSLVESVAIDRSGATPFVALSLQPHVYDAFGLFTVVVTVTDDGGAFDVARSVLVVEEGSFAVFPIAPIVGVEGHNVTATDAEFHALIEGATHTAEVQWGDGSLSEPVPVDDGTGRVLLSSLSHVYANDGVYTPSIRIADSQGHEVVVNFQAVIANAPPVVSLASSASGTEGVSTSIALALSDDGVLDAHSLVITWGDGEELLMNVVAGDGVGAIHHTYEDNGVFQVTVTAEDDAHATAVASSSVTVINANPVVTAPVEVSALPGHVSFSFSFTDLGVLDTHTASIDWDDGNVSIFNEELKAGSAIGVTHEYMDMGRSSFDVLITVMDNDGGRGEAATRVHFESTVIAPPTSNDVCSSLATAEVTSDGMSLIIALGSTVPSPVQALQQSEGMQPTSCRSATAMEALTTLDDQHRWTPVPCGTVLTASSVALLGSDPVCELNGSFFVASFNSRAAIAQGDSLFFQEPYATTLSDTSGSLPCVTVQQPTLPVGSIEAHVSYSVLCSTVVLDASLSSSSSTSPSPLRFHFTVIGPRGEEVLERTSCESHPETLIYCPDDNTDAFVLIPRRVFDASLLYSATVEVTMGSSTEVATVFFSVDEAPQVVTINAPSVIVLRHGAPVTLTASASSECLDTCMAELDFQWEANLVGVDTNRRALSIPQGTLQGGRQYRFRVNAAGYTSNAVEIHVLDPLPCAFMYGGSYRQMPITQPLIVDASGSTPAFRMRDGPLSFTWYCTVDGHPCIGSSELVTEVSAVLRIEASMLKAGTYSVTVVVRNAQGQEEEQCQTIEVLPRGTFQAFAVARERTSPCESSAERIVVDGHCTASVNTPPDPNARPSGAQQWGTFPPTEQPLTVVEAECTSFVVTPRGETTVADTTTITLSCQGESEGAAASVATVPMLHHPRPSLGSFQVHPTRAAANEPFEFVALDWDTVPHSVFSLEYQFAVEQRVDGVLIDVLLSDGYQFSNRLRNVFLPFHSREDTEVTVVLYVRSSEGVEARVTQTVRVLEATGPIVCPQLHGFGTAVSEVAQASSTQDVASDHSFATVIEHVSECAALSVRERESAIALASSLAQTDLSVGQFETLSSAFRTFSSSCSADLPASSPAYGHAVSLMGELLNRIYEQYGGASELRELSVSNFEATLDLLQSRSANAEVCECLPRYCYDGAGLGTKKDVVDELNDTVGPSSGNAVHFSQEALWPIFGDDCGSVEMLTLAHDPFLSGEELVSDFASVVLRQCDTGAPLPAYELNHGVGVRLTVNPELIDDDHDLEGASWNGEDWETESHFHFNGKEATFEGSHVRGFGVLLASSSGGKPWESLEAILSIGAIALALFMIILVIVLFTVSPRTKHFFLDCEFRDKRKQLQREAARKRELEVRRMEEENMALSQPL